VMRHARVHASKHSAILTRTRTERALVLHTGHPGWLTGKTSCNVLTISRYSAALSRSVHAALGGLAGWLDGYSGRVLATPSSLDPPRDPPGVGYLA